MVASTRSHQGKCPPPIDPGGEDAELLVHLQTLRWPRGFECPKCRLKSIAAPSNDGDQQNLPTSVPKPIQFAQLKRARGLIICPVCRAHISMTAYTLLDGAHTPLPKVYRAAGRYLRDLEGVTTSILMAEFGLGYPTARRLIDIFNSAAAPEQADLPRGNVVMEEFPLNVRTPKKVKDTRIIVVLERRNNGQLGRLNMVFAYGANGIYWIPYFPPLVHEPVEIDCADGNLVELLCSHKVMPSIRHSQSVRPSRDCAIVYGHVDAMLHKTHQGALGLARVQSILNGFSYRWNNRARDDHGLDNLMTRLLSVPTVRSAES